MKNKRLKDLVGNIILNGEINFVKRNFAISIHEAKKRIRPDIKRVLTILKIIPFFLNQLKEKALPYRGLEVGVGNGDLIFSLAKVFPEIEWSGIEHPGYEYLDDKLFKDSIQELKCHFTLCDIAQYPLPFKDNYFSLITFSEVLEHLPIEKILFVIKELQRVVCSGGYIIASSPNLLSFPNRIAMLVGRSIFAPPLPIHGGTFGHIHMYTVEEFISLCKPLGLEVKRIKYINLLRHMSSPKFLENIAYKACWIDEVLYRLVSKRLGDTWCVVLEK